MSRADKSTPSLSAKFELTDQSFVKDGPFLDLDVAVVEHLREEAIEPLESLHIRLEEV